MRRALALLALLASIAIAAPAARAGGRTYDLVAPRTCLAGSWGTSSHLEWRVQVGVFDDEAHAEALARALAAHGLAASQFIAAWLAGDAEPTVVVSDAFPSRAAAERAAARYRRRAGDAIVRRFVVWDR